MAREPRPVTRARILDAARRLFLTRGYARVTIEDVATKAGYTRGAVYSNFANKAELFLALIEERTESQHLQTVEELSAPLTPAERLETLARVLAAEAVRSREWFTAEVEFSAHAATEPDLVARIARVQREGHAALAGLLAEQCRILGIRPALPADELAVIVVSLIRGLTLEWMVDLTTDVRGLFAASLGRLLGGEPHPTPEGVRAHDGDHDAPRP